MTKKLTRRQVLKLMAVAAGTSVVACTKVSESLKATAQTIDKEEIFLPLVSSFTETPSPTETVTPPPSETVTPPPTATETPIPSETPTIAPTGVFIDGPGGNVNSADDTTIKYWDDGFQNGGAHDAFAPGIREHCLLRFNLELIPSGAACLSAKLYLTHMLAEAKPNPATGFIYSVSQANGDWVAGDKDIEDAGEGETCWNAKACDGNGGVGIAWAGSEGCSTSGIDYEPNAIGSYSLNPGDAEGTQYEIELDAERVADWFGSNNKNYGIIIIGTYSETHLLQSDYYISSYRPKLVVDYSS